jgi:bifunctional non-homologous end joining protein LigD
VPVLLDGEVVVLDEHGRPSFHLHQHRMQVRAPTPGLVREVPVQFYAFDLLHHAGESLLDQPYERRRAVLEALTDQVAGGPMRIPPYYREDSCWRWRETTVWKAWSPNDSTPCMCRAL